MQVSPQQDGRPWFLLGSDEQDWRLIATGEEERRREADCSTAMWQNFPSVRVGSQAFSLICIASQCQPDQIGDGAHGHSTNGVPQWNSILRINSWFGSVGAVSCTADFSQG